MRREAVCLLSLQSAIAKHEKDIGLMKSNIPSHITVDGPGEIVVLTDAVCLSINYSRIIFLLLHRFGSFTCFSRGQNAFARPSFAVRVAFLEYESR